MQNVTLTTLRPFWTTTAGKSIAIAVLLTLLVACGGASENPTPPPTTALGGNILVDGSSTVYPVTEAMAEEFMAVNRNVRVTVGISGTGGGFSKFCNNETDVSDASRP
ncbi:MAG: substrate-binding domain-containing protein, partial [Chloroflexi bacterium]|nr:substrate-binding domain-containing protein [Chloroflexota bacterium]